jgi:predicted phage baseplate assembly protein
LGSGNATLIFQNFKVPKAPLTYHVVPENTPPETPEAEIYVDGRLWAKVDSFFGRGPEEKIYIVREDAEGNSWVQFGDGKTGARLTSGVQNVTAIYRTGSGSFGNLKADTKVQASAKLKNLDKIGMPIAAAGGSQPEDGDNARSAAPGKVQSLGRIVSLNDFESEALAVPGVVAAAAAWQLVEHAPGVVITVLMETGRSAEMGAVSDTLRSYNTLRGPSRFRVEASLGKRMYVAASVQYALKPGFRADLVEPQIRRALGVNYALATVKEDQTGLFSLRRRRFGAREYASSIEGITQNVEGVLWAKAVGFKQLTDDDDPEKIPAVKPSALDPIVPCGASHILSLYDKHLFLTAVKGAS